MKKAHQIHKKSEKLTTEQTAQFLEDFANMVHGQDSKTKLISIRVPENVLNTFKIAATQKNFKYQSIIVRLMREWVQKN